MNYTYEQLLEISDIHNHQRSILDSYFIEYKKDKDPDQTWVDYYSNFPEYLHEYEKSWCFVIISAVAIIKIPSADYCGVRFNNYELRSWSLYSVPSETENWRILCYNHKEIDDLKHLFNIFNVIVHGEMHNHLATPKYEDSSLERMINNKYILKNLKLKKLTRSLKKSY